MITLFENFGNGKSMKTTDLWTYMSRHDTEFYEVFTTKEDAQKVADEKNKQIYNHYKQTHDDIPEEELSRYIKRWSSYYESMTVETAIQKIKDYIYWDNQREDGPY